MVEDSGRTSPQNQTTQMSSTPVSCSAVRWQCLPCHYLFTNNSSKLLRKTLGIPCMAKKTNNEVWTMIGECLNILHPLKACNLWHFGHVICSDRSIVETTIMTGSSSLWYATLHLSIRLPPTLHVPYQFNLSSSPSSSPSSYSDPGPLVDISYGVFHSYLKTFLFSKSFPP